MIEKKVNISIINAGSLFREKEILIFPRNIFEKTYFCLFPDSPDVKKAKEFEKRGVVFAESGNIDSALEMFNSAVSVSPTWASAYNNRAQALRLLRRDEGNRF